MSFTSKKAQRRTLQAETDVPHNLTDDECDLLERCANVADQTIAEFVTAGLRIHIALWKQALYWRG